MEEKLIIGYRKFKSKKGEAFCIVQASAPYSDKELAHGACGFKCEDIFIPLEHHDKISPSCLDRTLVLTYTIQSGRAFIADVAIK